MLDETEMLQKNPELTSSPRAEWEINCLIRMWGALPAHKHSLGGGSRLGEAPDAFLSAAGLISEGQIPSRDIENPVRLKGQTSRRRG